MTRFLSISTALGEAAALHGRQPTAEQFTRIEDALRERIVIDLESGVAGVLYDDGFVGDPATFVASELTRPWVETRSATWAASQPASDF